MADCFGSEFVVSWHTYISPCIEISAILRKKHYGRKLPCTMRISVQLVTGYWKETLIFQVQQKSFQATDLNGLAGGLPRNDAKSFHFS